MKHRMRKARHLIKKFNDSWGSLEFRFNQRHKNKETLRREIKENNQ